ncbi:Ig-like domain-containing protein [Clostridium ganghwense]|uniref:Ig-like domain-containing protein n=1 Tax=Clostridium ganghwense TaxID=312089 RepID=A0ABT4CPK9_9CLOT|nr:Ig-like domain-containing protein [Clostridium ganghwense]MCY6370989.1 Ig-like domain-containing protein [Clostridium ganghwense]
MAKQRKAVKVLSTAALAGLVASAALSSQAFAKVDSYQVKVGEDVFQYDRADLTKSFLAAQTEQEGAELYEDFAGKMKENGLHSFNDDVKGYVSYESAKQAFLAAQTDDTKSFALDTFTESEEAEVVEIPTVKKATLVDGEVVYDGDDSQTGDLKVTSVSAINAAQVKVTFNKVLTEDAKDEATDVENYKLENLEGNEIEDVFKAVDMEEGSKEAILTVDYSKLGDDEEDNYQNQTKYTLIFDENITGQEVKKDFKVEDFETPEVESVEVAGIRTIKVKLSEPVVAKKRESNDFKDLYTELDEAFEVNDGDYSIEKVDPIDNGKELNIVLYSDLKDGKELTVKVKSEAVDYAGYSLKKGTFKTTVDVNKEDLAIVGYEKAKDSEITLVFNKDVKFTDFEDDTKIVKSNVDSKYNTDKDNKEFKEVGSSNDIFDSFYHSSAKNEAEAIEIDGNKVTLHFNSDDLLPETAYVFVEADVLQDLWEKKNNDLNVKVKVTKDMTKPEIKELEQDEDSNRKIVITFTEDMDKKSAEKSSNYSVKDKDDKTVRVAKAELDGDEVTLTLGKDLEDGDKYKVSIEDVEDKAENKISDVTKEFTAKDADAVSKSDIKVRYYDAHKSSQKIVVDFDKKMLADGSRYAINNLENYDLTIVKGGETYEIGLDDYDDASIKAVEDAHKAEIKLPGNNEDLDDRFNFENAKLTLKVNKVEDANENKSTVFSGIDVKSKDTNIGLDEDDDRPIAVDSETVKVIFADELKIEKSDIKLGYYNADNKFEEVTPSSTDIKKDNGKTIVTYTLKDDDELQYDGKYKGGYDFIVKTVPTPESENNYGDTLIGSKEWTLKDEIAPALAKLKQDSDEESTTEVKFNVPLDDRDDFDDAVKIVSYDNDTHKAVVRLEFQESLSSANINEHTFKTDDDDVDVKDAKLVDGEFGSNSAILLTLDSTDAGDNYTKIADFKELGVTTGSNELFDTASDVNRAKVDAAVEIVDEDAATPEETAKEKAIKAANVAIAALPAVDTITVDTADAAQAKVDAAKAEVKKATDLGAKTSELTNYANIKAVEDKIAEVKAAAGVFTAVGKDLGYNIAIGGNVVSVTVSDMSKVTAVKVDDTVLTEDDMVKKGNTITLQATSKSNIVITADEKDVTVKF